MCLNARKKGLTTLYLLTQTAEKYFEKKGFEKIARDQTPHEVQQSKEFSHLCPSTAVAMKKQIL
jgi:amino-acid N-acetyltransferase